MSFYDPEKDYIFILSPREISFINKNIRKQNNQIKKYIASTPIPFGKEIPIQDEYIPLHYTHPQFNFYSHINDIYCFKVYSPIDISSYNIKNNTDFTPLNSERRVRTTIKEVPIRTEYDEEGKIVFPFRVITPTAIKSLNMEKSA